MVRDQDLAGEIVQSTFTKAWDELREGRELRHPKAWLYAVARNRSLDELRHRQRLADEPLIYAQVDPSRLSDPQAVAEDNEMVELVWSSAAALSPEEYSLLDLHVRHGLGAAEIADALGLERGAVYTRLSRLRNSLEESVALTLLIRRGRDDCPQLDAIVSEHGGMAASITPELRRTVRAHVKECEICGEARKRFVSPVVLFGALLPVVPLVGLQQGLWAGIVGGGAAAAAGASAAGGKGAVAARQGLKARYWVAGAAGVAAVGATLAVALSGAPKGHDPKQVASVDHTVGVPSSDRTVTMRWERGKNAEGYSVVFSRDKSIEPPARENVTGTTYTSSPLSPGSWWFILRTHGKDGSWTDTVRIGPFVITAAAKKTTVAKAAPKRHERRHRKARARPARAASVLAAALVTAPQQPSAAPGKPTAPHEPKAKKKQPPKKKKTKKKSPPASVPTPAPAPPVPPGEPVTQSPGPQPPPPGPGTNPPPCAHTSDGGGEGGGHGEGDHGHGDDGHKDDGHKDDNQCDPERD